MRIKTEFIHPAIPDRSFDWSAIDEDTYDGAEDSNVRHQIGYGATEQEAIRDLLEILEVEYTDETAIELGLAEPTRRGPAPWWS